MKRKRFVFRQFITLFSLIAFVTTCCMTLFLNMLARSLELTLTEANLKMAAGVTFGNVLLLSLICTIIDSLWHRWSVERPARRIAAAAEKLIRGNFDVRIPTYFATDESFSEVIACFNRMAEELAGIETLRTDFVSNVSHELKPPLAILQNYATMLSQPNLSDDLRREYAAAILSAASRLSSLVTNILKLNRLENAQIFPEPQRYDLTEQLCHCLLNFEEVLEKKQLNVQTELEEGVVVRADPEIMELVWNNLLSNAVKFTDPGGSIALRLRTQDACAVIEVQDSGCGISPGVGAHIFDKFYQGDTSHATQGNGLGLALVRQAIDISGSEISVQSEVGRGSTFAVRMRWVPDEA